MFALENGRFDVNLGGGVYKLRVPRPCGGKSRGYRVIVLFERDEKAFFVYGFAKSSRANITDAELRKFKHAAQDFFALGDDVITAMIKNGGLKEIAAQGDYHETNIQK